MNIQNKDFTYFKYEEILKAIQLSDHKVYSIIDWYKQKPTNGIVIRHDVDRWAINSLKIAELENKYDIKATYYFRKTKGSFKPDILLFLKQGFVQSTLMIFIPFMDIAMMF